jgi:hypothetical protein
VIVSKEDKSRSQGDVEIKRLTTVHLEPKEPKPEAPKDQKSGNGN